MAQERISLTFPSYSAAKQREDIERVALESSRVYRAIFGPMDLPSTGSRKIPLQMDPDLAANFLKPVGRKSRKK